MTDGPDAGGDGQVDEHPLAGCVDVDQGLQAVSYCCVTDGAKPASINWVEG
jgi:hypothetical protein